MSLGKLGAISELEFVQGEPIDVNARVPRVLEFWASWCGPCRTAIPHISELSHRYPSIVFVGITSESVSVASKFVRSMGTKMTYRVACDTNESAMSAASAFGLRGIPFAMIIDSSNNVLYAGHPMEPAFEAKLAELSSASASAAASAASAAASAAAAVSAVRGLTRSQLLELKPKALLAVLAVGGVAHHALEKDELVDLIISSGLN